MKGLEELCDALDVAILRVESGQSLAQALVDAPSIVCEDEWILRWRELRERLLKGQSSALEGLGSFRRAVALHLKIQRLVKRRSLLPLVQAVSVAFVSLMFLVVTQTFFRELFRLEASELVAALGLMLAGCLWIVHLLRAYRRDLWFTDWLDFIASISARLSWGQNLLPAWQQSMKSLAQTPQPLRVYLANSYRCAENYEPLPVIARDKKSDQLVVRCQTRWEQVHRLFVANERVLPVLQKEIENAYEVFQDGLERKAELLSAKLMLPLFLCFAPAYLLMLMAPLIRPFLSLVE